MTADVPLAAGHALVLNSSPSYVTRSGKNHRLRNPATRDPLSAERRLLAITSGVEYTIRALPMHEATGRPPAPTADHRVENSLFAKSYLYRAWSEEIGVGNVAFKRRARDNPFGVGDMIRGYVCDWLMFKLSYELATRLPQPDEVFGDAVRVRPSLDLEPETSHNVNFGPRVDVESGRLGRLVVDVNAFLRDAHNQIQLLRDAENATQTFQNLDLARSLGVEGATQWVAPGRWLELQGALTFQDLRNAPRPAPTRFTRATGFRIGRGFLGAGVRSCDSRDCW